MQHFPTQFLWKIDNSERVFHYGEIKILCKYWIQLVAHRNLSEVQAHQIHTFV